VRAKIGAVRIERVEPKILVIPLNIFGKKINMRKLNIYAQRIWLKLLQGIIFREFKTLSD
jgi:hypothetical protein